MTEAEAESSVDHCSPTVEKSLVPDQLQIEVRNSAKMALEKHCFLKFSPAAGSWLLGVIPWFQSNCKLRSKIVQKWHSRGNFSEIFACGGFLASPILENSLVPDQLQIEVQNSTKMALKRHFFLNFHLRQTPGFPHP